MASITILAKLVAQETDYANYTTYVFQVIDNSDKSQIGSSYLMCTRWPNWECRQLKNGETGYVQFKPVIAGIDTWYDGSRQVPYKYTNIVFEKFIPIQPDETISTEFKM